MPYKPLKPCAVSSCPNLTSGKYCKLHQQQADREYRQCRRDPRIDARYNNSEWRRIRESVLQDQPWCAMCKKEGRLTRAAVVHHIHELSEGGDNSPCNLVGLCVSCHNKIHATKSDRLRRTPKVYSY